VKFKRCCYVYKKTVSRKPIIYMPDGDTKRKLFLEAFGDGLLTSEPSLYTEEDYWRSSSEEERFDPADLPC